MEEPRPVTPLKLLSILGAIQDPVTKSINVVEVKPFFDWVNTPLRNTILSMRLLNVGEVEDATTYCSQFPEPVRKDKMDVETLARAIYRFNGVPLVTPEELDTFNKNSNTELTELEYKRFRIREFEVAVRDRLMAMYFALLQKQQRFLNGTVMDHVTGTVKPKSMLAPGYIEIRFSHAEVIEKDMLDKLTPQERKDLDDFMDARYVTEETPGALERTVEVGSQKPSLVTLDGTFRCRYCGKEFRTDAEVIVHVENECDRVNAPIAPPLINAEGTSFERPAGPGPKPS